MQPLLRSDGDIPEKLSGLKFESEDKVLYVKGGLPTVATTLRGVLRRALGEAEGLRLFAEISEKDSTIYDWAARGPRVFDVCTADNDIVALCEYDVHTARASYATGDQPFHAAMASQGYDGAFFTDPLIGRTPPAGLGVFWRSDVFELVEAQEERVIACNTTTVSLSNHDLLEKWHPLVVPPTDGGGVTSTAVWKSNFGRPTPSTRCRPCDCVCLMAWRCYAIDATLCPWPRRLDGVEAHVT